MKLLYDILATAAALCLMVGFIYFALDSLLFSPVLYPR